MSSPFAEFVFDNTMDIDRLGEEEVMDKIMEYHNTKKYPKHILDAWTMGENIEMIEDETFEIIIYNQELIDKLRFISRD